MRMLERWIYQLMRLSGHLIIFLISSVLATFILSYLPGTQRWDGVWVLVSFFGWGFALSAVLAAIQIAVQLAGPEKANVPTDAHGQARYATSDELMENR